MLTDNIALFVSIGVFVISVVLGFIVVPHLKRVGAVNESHIKNAEDILHMSKSILSAVNMNTRSKDLAAKVFDVTEIAVRYVEQTMKDEPSEDKKEQAIEVSMQVLKEMNVSVDDKTLNLIEVGIEAAVNYIDKK